MLAISLTVRDSSVSWARFSSGTQRRSILSCSAGMIEIRLALPQRSPQPLIVPCTWVHAGLDRRPARWPPPGRRRCGVWMPSRVGTAWRTAATTSRIEARQAAAVGVTQRDPVGARLGGRPDRRQRVAAIGAKAVEEVLGVVDDFFPLLLEEGDAVARSSPGSLPASCPARAVTCSFHDLPTMHTTGVCASTSARRIGSPSALPPALRVLPNAVSFACFSVSDLRAPEELDVFRVRSRVAALDEVDAEAVEQARDLQLVLDRERETLALCSVAQRRVEELDVHGWLWLQRESSPQAYIRDPGASR